MKTTITLRDDVYQYLTLNFGKRELSSTVNQLLAEKIFGKLECKSMFGADKWLRGVDWSDVRDESDHDY